MNYPVLTGLLWLAVGLSGCASTGSSTETPVVSRSSNNSLSDSDAVSAVKDALKQDPQLASAAIDVTAQSGIVTLSGQVQSAQAYNRAISLTRSLTGRPPVATGLKFP